MNEIFSLGSGWIGVYFFEKNQLEIIRKLSGDRETLKQSIMWYEKLIKSKIDGLSPLLSLFESEEDFYEHFFRNVKFFNPEDVKKQSIALLEAIEKGEPIPVRYSMKTKDYFHYKNEIVAKGVSKKAFKNKKEAADFARITDLIHNDTELRVCIDKDGNYSVRNEIYKAVRYRVSQGAISDVRNYVISHIWGKTENPYFFTSLWNIVLIPNYLSFILDKPDENSEIVRRIKIIAKTICQYLYNPTINQHLYHTNSLISKDIIEVDKLSIEGKIAEMLLEKKLIHYMDTNVSQQITEQKAIQDPYDMLMDLRKIIDENKKFVFAILDKLKTSNTEFINLFVDQKATKNICKLSYPILVEITGDSPKVVKQKNRPVKSSVYYSKDYFEFNSKLYLVCNDWHTINKEMLLEWLTGITE